MPNKLELSNSIFTRITVLREALPNPKPPASHWVCVCSCNPEKEWVVRGANLINGTTKSCGCLKNEMAVTHGAKTRFTDTHGATKGGVQPSSYRSWGGMMRRCYNPDTTGYKNWGGRGITVCERWHEYLNFLSDMGEPLEPSLSIERKDNSLGYSKENCYWATYTQQGRNKRNNHLLEYKGETLCLVEWSEKLKINFKTLHNRIQTLGWDTVKAFETPVRKDSRNS